MLSVCIKTRGECMPWVSPLFATTWANSDPGHTLLMGLKGFTRSAVYIEFLCCLF